MRFYLSPGCALKHLEAPSAYSIKSDELYELDPEAFEFLNKCSSPEGCESPENEFTGYCLKEGILTGERVAARRPPPLKSPEPSLRYLELQITRRCNLRCGHCFLGPPVATELAVEEVARVLEEFERMQGLRVLITGGEPLTHSRFDEINALLPGFSLRKVLLTNGVLLDEKTLKGLNVDEIQVSLDGLEKAHDELRGAGTFKRAMECVERALAVGLDVSVSTMAHPGNLGDFDGLERALGKLGVKDWTVDVPCAVGNLKKNPSFRLSPEDAGESLRYGFGQGLHGGGEGYACGLHLMSVAADGVCAKCAFYSEESPEGHIGEGLGRCWGRIRHTRLDELQCDCDEVDRCRGGCRYRAGLLGSPLGKDLYKCSAYDKL